MLNFKNTQQVEQSYTEEQLKYREFSPTWTWSTFFFFNMYLSLLVIKIYLDDLEKYICPFSL